MDSTWKKRTARAFPVLSTGKVGEMLIPIFSDRSVSVSGGSGTQVVQFDEDRNGSDVPSSFAALATPLLEDPRQHEERSTARASAVKRSSIRHERGLGRRSPAASGHDLEVQRLKHPTAPKQSLKARGQLAAQRRDCVTTVSTRVSSRVRIHENATQETERIPSSMIRRMPI